MLCDKINTDPETGRFISADSIDYLASDTVNGLNLYAYCGNNPVMNVDPSGHWSWKGFWTVVAAVAIVAVVTAVVVATAGTAAVALGASAATVSAVMAGAAICGVVAGGLEIGGQIVENGAENIDLGAVAIETFVGSVYGATSGVMGTTTSAGLRLGMRAVRVGNSVTGTVLHGINAGDSGTEILSDALRTAAISAVIQAVFVLSDHRVGKTSSSILEAYKIDGALNWGFKQKLMSVGVLLALAAKNRSGVLISALT